ncbi:MAG TPA: transglycosylase SLT domain-containing protein [Gemmatimonadales bacterium]|nr:transglycosylase SLT domain-containing protein [Gemmatimonadales bacterium]
MTRPTMRWLWIAGAAVLATGCASAGARSARGVPGATVAPVAGVPADTTAAGGVARDSAADQSALDSLHGHAVQASKPTTPLTPTPPAPAAGRGDTTVRGEDVQREAERLFGSEEAKTILGANDNAGAVFDIDVTTFSANRRVLEYLEFFQLDARDRFEIWLSRLGRYEGMIRERLRSKGLPEDLVYLTLIESGLSNTAVSRARAVGMWQFMTGTGRMYGLQIDPWVDERRDPFKATDAAVNHLADLVERLGSVYLAAAAYNAGAGRIERGIRRLPGEPDSVSDQTFFQIADRRYLRRETRDYVPKLIAAALIAKQPGRYGFTEIMPLPPLVFDEVTIPDATGLDVLARLADTTVAAMLELNPHFVRGITPPGRSVVVRVPRGTGVRVAERFAELPVNERITFVDHYVSQGQTLSEIAQRYRVSVAMLRGANPLLRSSALRIGQRIIVPMSGRVVPASAWSVPPEPRYRRVRGGGSAAGRHRVAAGETASSIARRYGVGLTALLNANGMTMGSVIRPGEWLRIPK